MKRTLSVILVPVNLRLKTQDHGIGGQGETPLGFGGLSDTQRAAKQASGDFSRLPLFIMCVRKKEQPGPAICSAVFLWGWQAKLAGDAPPFFWMNDESSHAI